jgi:hypothetical protein
MARQRSSGTPAVAGPEISVLSIDAATLCHADGVRNEAFYSTVAQVLPTLLIAIAVEYSQLMRARLDRIDELKDQGGDAFGFSSLVHAIGQALLIGHAGIVAVLFAAIFLAGEVATLAVLFFGTDGWLPWVAGPLGGLAVLVLSSVAIFVPFRRLWEQMVT